MRKIASATLIFILFFNLFGYRFVSDYLQQKYDTQLEARLDKNHYNEAELVELKIPINLPYQTRWSAFERYNGEVEFDGVLYKYVKRKVADDTLILLCIPNHQKMNLQTAKNDFFKTTNDLVNNSKKSGDSKTISFKKIISEYEDHTYSFKANAANNDQKNFGLANLVTNLLSSPHISPEQPPDFIRA